MKSTAEPMMTRSVIAAKRRMHTRRQHNAKIEEGISGMLQELCDREMDMRTEERSRERARIARDLHDTLFQGFFIASMLLQNLIQASPVHSIEQRSLQDALDVIGRALKEGRCVLQDLSAAEPVPSRLEEELSGVFERFPTSVVRCGVSVAGHSRVLEPAIQEQINLIGREALVNALLHSEATCVEAEVEYLPHGLRFLVRDNGRGLDAQEARTQESTHWGLTGMRHRAESIGAIISIGSSPGAGTKVELVFPGEALEDSCLNQGSQSDGRLYLQGSGIAQEQLCTAGA